MKRVSAVVLLKEDGSALFQLRDNKPGLPCAGQWSLPSGRRERDETPESCARRELWEETGYACGELHPLGVLAPGHDGYENYRMTAFWANYDGLQPLKCLEGQEIRFIEREAAGRYSIPDFILPVWDSALQAVKVYGIKK